jgi:hypothetical protein
MKEKKFKHEKKEECALCQKVINTEKDNWVSLLDFTGDKQESLRFYHRFCLTDLIKGQGRIIAQNFEEKVKKMAGGLFKNIKPMMDKMNNNNNSKDKEVVYQLK